MTFSRFTVFCCISLVGFAGQIAAQQQFNNQQQQFNNQQRTGNQYPDQQQQFGNQGRQANPAQINGNQQLASARGPQRPFPELTPEHAQLLDRILDLWQQSSGQVKRYTADFRRWDYDPLLCNERNPQDNRLYAHSISDGKLRYASPDKGMFETTAVYDFTKEEGQNPDYKPRENTQLNHEKWICDGQAIYEFDFTQKKLYETPIPAEMQGQGLVNSPLPFLFGVDKQIIKDRYWIRVITPQQVQQTEVWLEAYPKDINDARNYQRLEIILSQDDWMPKMLHVYLINYNARTNPVSRVFEFGNRKINSQLDKFKDIMGFFVRPQTPLGWKRGERPVIANPQTQPPVNLGQNPNQNTRDQGFPRR